jgi:hypothetical protein
MEILLPLFISLKDLANTKGDRMSNAFAKLASLSAVFIVSFFMAPAISWLSWQGGKSWYIAVTSASVISALLVPFILTMYLNGLVGYLSGVVCSGAYLISVLFFFRCTNFWDELSLAIHFIVTPASILSSIIALVFKAYKILPNTE